MRLSIPCATGVVAVVAVVLIGSRTLPDARSVAAAAAPEADGPCPNITFGPWVPQPPVFASQAQLCAAFHGFPIPPNLIPNPAVFPEGGEAYVAGLATFVRDRNYIFLGWLSDREIRLTGPYEGCPPDGLNFGTHPAVHIFYSPEVVEWLCNGRVGALPAGSMIVKEQWSITNIGVDGQDLMWVPQNAYDPAAPTSWSVMVKAADGSHDGWFWAGIGPAPTTPSDPGNPPITSVSAVTSQDFYDDLGVFITHAASHYPTGNADSQSGKRGSVVYPYYGFGISACLNCHASAISESTYATLENILGGEKRYAYVPGPGNGDPPNHDEHGAQGDLQQHVYANPLTTPDPLFLDQIPFPSFPAPDGVPFSDVFATRLPAQTYDHNGATGPLPNTEEFLTSDQCIGCHDAALNKPGTPATTANMIYPPDDPRGVNLSPYAEWSVSPMGLAGRDPIFYAQLESETNLEPGLRDCIETVCLHCHGVMGQRQISLDNPGPLLCGSLLGAADTEFGITEPFLREYLDSWAGNDPANAKYGGLGRDGISCAVCHKIDAELPEPGSFTGNFGLIAADRIVGPYATDVKPVPMQQALGLTPQFGAQLNSSALCGSCHAIELPVLDNASQVVCDKFEQTTFLEWQNSDFAGGGSTPASCQDCHMPRTFHVADEDVDLSFKIANIEDNTFPNVPNRLPAGDITLAQREPYGRHTLYGLNVFLNEMFQQFPLLLGHRQVDYLNGYPDPALLTAREAVLRQAGATATIEIESLSLSPTNVLTAEVTVTNLAGHSFPSGVGFRRAFIEFLVRGDDDSLIWASGRTNDVGVILRGTTLDPTDTLPSEFNENVPCPDQLNGQCYQPHHEVITSDEQVQIYEELIQDARGIFTTSFLHRYDTGIKDNRLRPRGWTWDGPWAAETKPEGTGADPDYGNPGPPDPAPQCVPTPPLPSLPLTGADTVTYSIQLTPEQAQSLAEVEATLYYQATPPYYLKQRVDIAEAGPNSSDTARLYYMASRLNTAATAADGETFIEQWKLRIDASGPVVFCPWDLDGDGAVGFIDLLTVLSSWGPCVGCPSDFDGDGIVGFLDLLAVLSAWGPCA